ncbi:PilZ domain-containing protein [Pseudomonas alcaligenes]|uniref:PilZ domain-containing protein n=1 Tax=Aquipseudomonas alcaligenes TaxID=43263 RepID=A0ABR7RXA5_AQUAC|nr:PilZ domain-containing protein [Pseudomonas alcaligenes]MBC9249818.1 PilZ domain-containing protein [Pseudomonas alcaligenes]
MRQHSRVVFRPANRLQLLERASGEPLGLIADLSLGGLRLIAEGELVSGACLQASIEVPVREGRYRLVEVDLVCQWSRRAGRAGRYEQGFALAAPAPAFVELVASLKATQSLSRSLKV